MMMLEKIKLAFGQPSAPEAIHSASQAEAVRKIVMSRSHGNVRLQRGQYYTKKDVDERRAEIRKIKFVD